VLTAVADSGSVNTAARTLAIGPLDVMNRIDALAKSLSCELVVRSGDRVALTSSGERAVGVARAIADQLTALAAEVGGERGEISGTLCVTSTAGFMQQAEGALEELREKYPALQVDAMVSSHVVNLHRREADVAIRMFRDQQDGLALHKLGTIGWSLYGSERYLAGRARGANVLDGHVLIAYDDNFSNTSGGRWIASNASPESIGMRVSGIRQAIDAAEAHHGICIVPCYLTGEHKVVRVTEQVLATNDVYAVHLADRSKEARIKVVIDGLVDLFLQQQTVFAGT